MRFPSEAPVANVQRIANAYNVRANLHLDGNEYGKDGTTFRSANSRKLIRPERLPETIGKKHLENIVWSDCRKL